MDTQSETPVESQNEVIDESFVLQQLSNYIEQSFKPKDEEVQITEGVKNDTGKPRLDLIPSEAIMALGEVLHFGAAVEGYNERNWEKGMDWGRVYGALQRHLWKWWAGIETDDKSGLSHLSHAIANLAFLIAYSKRGIGKDTRK